MSDKLSALRQQHPQLIYKNFTVTYADQAVQVVADYVLVPDIAFRPTVVIEGVSEEQWAAIPHDVMQNLAFHIGMAEMLSYWKAACPPKIVIEAGYLTDDQIAWWHNLLLNGMGEFFYQNQIDFTMPDFVAIQVGENVPPSAPPRFETPQDPQNILIPIGGGKDSVVTIEILGDQAVHVGTLALNTTQATDDTIRLSKSESTIHVRRTIDLALLNLNQQGYLNGHTPFSSVLAFISVACAAIFGYRYIALSNERSSNEGNQIFHGQVVNHQYSKTYLFEASFRRYVADHLATTIDYFSYLRPLYELQIAALFAQLEAYHPVFRSCNVGQKTNSWCHNCPKCLFVYTILYPFMTPEQLGHVFTHDLFTRTDLLPLARELAGLADVKPFECVGTHEESLVAFYLAAEKYRQRGEELPIILQSLHDESLAHQSDMPARARTLLHAWNDENAIPAQFTDHLRQRLAAVVEGIAWA